MLRIVKLVFLAAAVGGFIWFFTSVNLGEQTLYGHIKAIGSSQESQKLVEGTKQKASEVTDGVGSLLGTNDDKEDSAGKDKAADKDADKDKVAKGDAPAQEIVSDTDRQALGKVIRQARN
jgi:hypothetical protein